MGNKRERNKMSSEKHRKLKLAVFSIRMQVIMMFILLTVLLVGIITQIYTGYYRRIMENEVIRQTINTGEQISTKTEMFLGEANKILQWGNSTDAYDFLNAEGTRREETLQLINDIKMYRTSMLIDKTVQNVYLFDIDGTTYNEKIGIYQREKYRKSIYIYEKIMQQQDCLIFVSKNEAEEDMILYGTSLCQPATGKIIGYIVIEFKNKAFEKILDDVELGDSGSFFMINDENQEILLGENRIYNNLKGKITFENENGYMQVISDKKKVLMVYCKIPHTRAILGGCVYLSELTQSIRNMTKIFLIISVFLTILFGLGCFIVATHITKPIWMLKEKMLETAEGNLNAYIEEYHENEFGILERQYNTMLKEIRELLKKSTEDQQNLKKAELKALQSQINPHFLYNTLDTIMWLVAVNENEKAIEMIESLSVFFKTGLSKGMDWIPVEREIEHVKSYLYIQQSRYSDILQYVIDISPDMIQYDMLKMTLQPIVENAIYHGIKNKENGGSIIIKGNMDGKFLSFLISDTGVGMEAEAVTKLNERMQENKISYEECENGFGLYNVNRRIKLYCGEESGITVESQIEEGTKVHIRMLAIRREEHKNV